MKSAILKRSVPYNYVIYKYNNEKEYSQAKRFMQKLKRSVDFISEGSIKASDLGTFAKYADSLEWKALDLKSGDLFIFTREVPSVRQQEEEKQTRIGLITDSLKASAGLDIEEKQTSNMASPSKPVHPRTGKPMIPWTPQEIAQLWDGTGEEVAAKLGRSEGAVLWQRRQFVLKNKNFVVPEKAKYTPQKVKAVAGRKVWTEADLAKLWVGSGKRVAKMLKRTEKAIYNKRLEFMQEHPDFVPPPQAKFTTKSKTVKPKGTRDNFMTSSAGTEAYKKTYQEEVQKLNSNTGFTFKVGNQEITLPEKPKKLKLGDTEIEF